MDLLRRLTDLGQRDLNFGEFGALEDAVSVSASDCVEDFRDRVGRLEYGDDAVTQVMRRRHRCP
ncbi:hypothetical protein GCM10009583_10690 [Ornithinicoccus hortensis]